MKAGGRNFPDQTATLPVETRKSPPHGDPFAAALRGFGVVGVLAALVIILVGQPLQPLGGILVLAWAVRSHTPWREIGYVRPKSWIGGLAVGVVFGIAFKLLMKAIVMPLAGAVPINQAYHFLVGNRAALPRMVFTMIASAGFGEETMFRGYMFERLFKLWGSGPGARVSIVLLTTAVFALAHYPDQGLAGAEQATITGLVFGTIVMITGRLWTVMCAHAAFDLAAVAIIYWNVETNVAHLIFK